MIKPSRYRNSRIRGQAILCCALLLAIAGGAANAVANPREPGDRTNASTKVKTVQSGALAFDFDNGNAISEVLFRRVSGALRQTISPKGNDATFIIRISALAANAWFDAIAPYQPTAIGIYSNLGRRPASERATNRNLNIAILYASYRVYNSLAPENAADWRTMMTDVGLDPDDDQENTTTAIGIGNSAGNAVMAHRVHDGMNQLGDEGWRKYNRQPYADYLGYKPVNTAYELSNPSRWQPAIVTKGNGIFQVQQFVSPQFRVTRPYTYDDPERFRLPPPRSSDHTNREAYKKQVDEILAASAELNDERKAKVEYFDDKFFGLGYSTAVAALNKGLSLSEFVNHLATEEIAAFDALIAAWYNKYVYDSVRPFSAVPHVYGDRKVTAWGGPGKGTVKDIPATEWASYVGAPDHPDYPSGSTSMCAAIGQAGRRLDGDEIEISYPVAKGASKIEPGVTPATDITLKWTTWSDYVKECGLSRLWGGVHFMAAVKGSWDLGRPIGDRAYELVQRHIKGQVSRS